ncbi:hypothetical protein HX900_14280 [Rhizobium sp. WYCCWR 11290]|uniref:Uncharacterized protein n=1 Tax=Rhizobium changzhiense TaxID=2692317 RepID=A0A7Z0RL75_9HYPH|nr:hypothetical protein [Rhizobium changzhiense]NZD62273.1 hypothetical protein [Rhizobium changzhiense]
MVSSNVLGCLAIASIYYLVPQQSPSQEAVHPIKVTFAVVVEGKEPFSAEVSCLPDDTCSLAKHDGLGIDLATTVFSGSEAHGELSIYCSPNPCSFRNLRSRMAFFGRRATVDILSGEPDFGVATSLVIRQRPEIGEVLISY